MLRKCFVWPETGSLWVRASWWSVLSNGLFLQSCPRQYLQERLGWDLAAARRMLALQPLLVCVYSDVSAWHVGTGREWLKDLAVYIVWPWTELSCRALWPVAFTLLVLHLSRAQEMPLQCPGLFPSWGSCLQLDSRVKKGTLIFQWQCLLTEIEIQNRNGLFRIRERHSWLKDPLGCSKCKQAHCSHSCKSDSASQEFHWQCHREGGRASNISYI